MEESAKQRSDRILNELSVKYPDKKAYDLDGRGEHFVTKIEPASDQSEYDLTVEVIISSKPHKHIRTTQNYKVLSGTLELHDEEKTIILQKGSLYTVVPPNIHWAKSENECWVEILSKPGWTKEDHIVV